MRASGSSSVRPRRKPTTCVGSPGWPGSSTRHSSPSAAGGPSATTVSPTTSTTRPTARQRRTRGVAAVSCSSHWRISLAAGIIHPEGAFGVLLETLGEGLQLRGDCGVNAAAVAIEAAAAALDSAICDQLDLAGQRAQKPPGAPVDARGRRNADAP